MLTKGIVFEGQRYWSPDSLTKPPATTLADVSRYGNGLALAGTAGWVRLPNGLWTLSLDGDSDYASKVIPDFRQGDYAGTMSIWFKTSSSGTRILFGSADFGSAVRYVGFDVSNTLRVIQVNNDVLCQVSGNIDVRDGNWHLGVLTSSGIAWSIYLDGVAELLTVNIGSNNGDWFGDTTLRDNISIGALIYDSIIGYYFNGQLALPKIWDRALSPGEILALFESERSLFGV